MSFNISLSGLNAASADLSVTSNDISNVGTIGYKESRAEFADIFAATPLGTSSNAIGSGVRLANVSQQFGQGNLEFTENTLDLAITGEGFFVVRPNQTSNDVLYTRAGAFNVDQNGNIANSSGQILQVFPVDATTGNVSSTSLSSTIPLSVPNTIGVPQATSQVDINLNFPAAVSPAIAVAGIDAELAGPAPVTPSPTNYHHSTSATVFDSQGNSHILTMYFVMTDDLNNTWEVRSTLDGTPMTRGGGAGFGPGTLDFNSSGVIDVGDADGDGTTTTAFGGVAGAIDFDAITLTNGAAPLNLVIDFSNQGNTLTQESQGSFTVQSLNQDGFATGRLTGLEVDDEGLVRATFTNGQTTALGKIALARFDNPQGLRQTGNTTWVETTESGAANAGEAGTGNFGLIESGALESSNVDLTAELVQLITAQRNFQANSKAIETANAITQTVINIR
jgi:flagellar hook protein FlgE